MNKQQPFFKGILGFTRQSSGMLSRDAEDSIYRWWWEFMRLNPVFWYARTKEIDPVDPKIAETYKLVGDLSHPHFNQWWRNTGVNVFAEEIRPPKVTNLDLFNLDKHSFIDKALYLEIPLNIRKETILKQVKKLLDEHHDGRGLDLAGTTTAQLKFHTKRYRLRVIEIEYWVLLYRMLYPNIENWRIGDRLQLSPHLKLRDIDRKGEPRLFDGLSSLTGRYLYKGKFMLNNLLYGKFPNSMALNLDESFMPFGKEHHEAYLEATKLNGGDQKSEFHLWLLDQHTNSLKHEVIRRNRLEENYRKPLSQTWRRMPAFVAGESDLV